MDMRIEKKKKKICWKILEKLRTIELRMIKILIALNHICNYVECSN